MRRLVCLLFMGGLVAALSACGRAPETADRELRLSIQGSNNDPALVKRRDGYQSYLAKVTGRPVKLFEASDYNGVIQALASGQVDVATLAGAAYANADAQVGDKIAPILTVRHADGGTGYYSALVVRADSPYRKLQDLRGLEQELEQGPGPDKAHHRGNQTHLNTQALLSEFLSARS